MNKQKYLRKLRKSLDGVPNSEKENLIEYYAELIDDSYERGKTSREIFSELEDPETVAQNYLRENGAFKEKPESSRRNRRERERNPLPWVLLFPLWLPLFLVAFALALAVAVVGIVLVVVDAVLVVSFAAAGLYAIVMSFGLFPENPLIAVVQIGLGIALLGLAWLCALTVAPVCRGYGSFMGWVFRGFRRSDRVRERRSRSKLPSVALSLALLVVGGVVGTVGYAYLGFDYRKLAVCDDYRQVSRSVETEGLSELTFEADNLCVVVRTTQEEQLAFTYFETPEQPKTFSVEDGKITFESGDNGDLSLFGASVREAWERGIFFGALTGEYNRAEISVPVSYAGSILVNTVNGYILMENGTYGNVKLTTRNGYISIENVVCNSLTVETHNGYISADGVRAEGEIAVSTHNGYVGAENCTGTAFSIKTDNGYVNLEDGRAEKIAISTSNGAVEVDGISANEIRITANNGSVTGSIAGRSDDFSVDASAHNGSCNLQNKSEGDKTLFVSVKNGKIRLSFEEK